MLKRIYPENPLEEITRKIDGLKIKDMRRRYFRADGEQSESTDLLIFLEGKKVIVVKNIDDVVCEDI